MKTNDLLQGNTLGRGGGGYPKKPILEVVAEPVQCPKEFPGDPRGWGTPLGVKKGVQKGVHLVKIRAKEKDSRRRKSLSLRK